MPRRLLVLAALAFAAVCAGASFSEFPVPTAQSGVGDLTSGPDGALWFTEPYGDKVGRMTTGGVAKEYKTLSKGTAAAGIRTGPDGALWFCEPFSNKIGRVTTAGTVTESTLPSSDFGPLSIATGPDGALWFTLIGSSEVGRLTTDGHFQAFLMPGGNRLPFGITVGPDGNLWITESPNFFYFLLLAGVKLSGSEPEAMTRPVPDVTAAPAIWRLTPAGVFTKFTSSKLLTDQEWIVPGPDGALWFTQNQIVSSSGTGTLTNSGIGRITTDGTITTFPLPVPTSGALGMTPGPDGALWFTEPEPSANRLGRITTDGSISEVKIPTARAIPEAVTVGPDGAIWFAESGLSVNKIGRYSLTCIGVASRSCVQPTAVAGQARVGRR